MSLNWINVEEYSFNSFLLMERFSTQNPFKVVGTGQKAFAAAWDCAPCKSRSPVVFFAQMSRVQCDRKGAG